MLASPLPPSFLDTYCLSTSFLGYSALCMVISFLVLWSICLNSLLVHFRKGPEYRTGGYYYCCCYYCYHRCCYCCFFYYCCCYYHCYYYFYYCYCGYYCFFNYSSSYCCYYYYYYYCYYYFTSCEFFIHHRHLVVFRGSESANKYLLVSRTLLSILADLNKVIVSSSDFRFFSSLYQAFTVRSESVNYTIILILHYFPRSHTKSKYFFIFLLTLAFPLCDPLGRQSPFFGIITMSGLLYGIWWSFLSQNPKEFCASQKDRFWFVHLPLFSLIKFKFLAQFPVDHFPQLVTPRLVLLLR